MRIATMLAMAIALLVVVACSADEDAPTVESSPEPTPDIPATVFAQVQATIAALEHAEPEPTTEPSIDRSEIIAFANLHSGIETRWDDFHSDVDAWRQGLVACDLTIRNQSVAVFSSRFAAVTEGARGLPREELVRSVTDQIIEAAEREAAALRLFSELVGSDTKIALPDESTVSAAEFVLIERAAAADVRLTAEAELADLLSATSDTSRSALSAFAADVSVIDAGWDGFITAYEGFRASQSGLDATGVADAINVLVAQFIGVSTNVAALPSGGASDEVATQLGTAARDTELALRTLRDAVVSDTGSPEFATFEAQLITGNSERSTAAALLTSKVDGASVENGLTAAAFDTAYRSVATTWDRFHQDYDEWRASNGGCDVTEVLSRLGEFVIGFGDIATDVRAVPRATALRTLGELLIEAAEREAQAVAGLRAGWQPFDASVYEQFDLSRNAANKLRRQVSSGLEELLAQNGISQADLG